MKVRLHSFNSVFKGPFTHWLVLLFALPHAPLEAAEPQFATPQARAVWGSPFNAHLELSRIGFEASTQLNEHCMSSWLEPVGDQPTQAGSNGVRIKYSRTTADRGLLNLRSEMNLKEPVVRLVVESRCPLVEFSRAWIFQVDMGSSREPDALKPSPAPDWNRDSAARDVKDFDLRASSELVHSFNRPKYVGRTTYPALQAGLETSASKPAPALARELAQAAPPKTEPDRDESAGLKNKPQSGPGESVPASPGGGLATAHASADSQAQGLITRQPESGDKLVMIHSQDSLALNEASKLPGKGPEVLLTDGLAAQSLTQDAESEWMATAGVTLGVLTLLLAGSGLWWMRRRQWFGLGQGLLDAAKTKVAPPPSAKHNHSRLWLTEALDSSSMQDSADEAGEIESESPALSHRQGQDTDAMSKQFFESLLGVSKARDLMGDAHSGTREVAERVAKRSASEQLIHKVSLGPWALPESYSPLLPGHLVKPNDSGAAEAASLHLELNLIELAFMGAQEHRHLDEGEVLSLIEAHGVQFRAPVLEAGSSHEPSDLIRDFLRARACEFKNRADLEEFQSALTRMADFSTCKPYCMGHPQWSECVQDLTLG